MPAKIYTAPTQDPIIGRAPSLDDYITPNRIDEYWKACTAWKQKIIEWAKKYSKTPDHELIGFAYKYPVADGYAEYIVFNVRPVELIHLPLGDAWHIPEVVRRGLNITELKGAKKRDEALKELFRKGK